MLVAPWLRERVYYVAFAGEFKQTKSFCVPKVPCGSRDSAWWTIQVRNRDIDRNPDDLFCAEKRLESSTPRQPRICAAEVFLRPVDSAWYAHPIPVRISASIVAFMKKIIVAVGSTRKPKLRAVMRALDAFAPKLIPDGDFEVVGVEVESGVSPTPTSCEELMRGARQRVESLVKLARESRKPWRFFVGLEGGLEVLQDDRSRRVFLESWAYVSDGTRGFYGRSGGIELPEELAHEVLERGFDLSEAIDRFAGAVGIRDGQGAWGVLSGDLIPRDESFHVAVITAFAPFYNARMYGRATQAAT
jgi:inosine/xanthosine triphosphatase